MRRNAKFDRTNYAAFREPISRDGKFIIQPTTIRYLNMRQEVSEAIRPWVLQFEARDAERREFVDAFRILSPAATAHEGMTILGGTDAGRHSRFREAAATFYRAEGKRLVPRVMSGVPTSAAEVRAAPRFIWVEDPVQPLARAALSLAQILVPTALILLLARFRLRGPRSGTSFRARGVM